MNPIMALIFVIGIGIFLAATALYSSGEMALLLSVIIFLASFFIDAKYGLNFMQIDILVIAGIVRLKVITVLFGYVWYLAGYVFGNIAKWVLGLILIGILIYTQGLENAVQIAPGEVVYWILRGEL